MKTLKTIRKLTDGFLKKYELVYDADGQEVRWEMVSLNPLKTAADLASRLTAVEIIARFDDGDYLLCREFRFPVNDEVYEFPTGMIDGDESPETAAARELYEETGLRVIRVDRVLPPACYSVGVTDELIVPVFVTVAGDMRSCDTAYEQIRSYKMSPRDIRRLLATPGVKITETCLLVLAGAVTEQGEA
ncbi:MAG: NUDIX hydrolase [Clostridia bacterium]|nr:NUDIX hydrolase [Clostridia bacterium]